MQNYAPGTRIGQYEIASRPMMGGMGVVYFALDHGNEGRPVAIKTFRPEFLPDRAARDRFLREGTAWVELGSHPHIVRCYRVEYIDPTAFLVLELIAKEPNLPDASLRSWLIPGHPLPIEQALLFALQIARGMQHATKKIPGFVHRDLKPENILVGADKLPGTNMNRLRVTDFGLVKTTADSSVPATTSNRRVLKPNQIQFTRGAGTPLYMAPEQWNGEPVGVFTDVYAFGCILYEMLSGQHAAKGKKLTELVASHCNGKLRPLPTGLPEGVIVLVKTCLALDPNQRFQSWRNVTNDIERVYTKVSRKPALSVNKSIDLSREERKQVAVSYNEIGLSYLGMGQAAVAASYFKKVLKRSRQLGDREGEGAALNNLGEAYRNLGDVRRAISYYEEAQALAHRIGFWNNESDALANLGNAFLSLGDAQRAIRYYKRALPIKRKIGDRVGEGKTLGNLGTAYKNLGDVQKAIEYHEQHLTIVREIGDQRGEGNILNNMGEAYQILGDVKRAIGFYEEQLTIARQIGDRQGESNALGNLGVAYAELGRARQAIGYFEQAKAIQIEISDLNSAATSSLNMALIYTHQGDVGRALPLAQEAAQIWSQIGSSRVEHAQQLIAHLKSRGKSTQSNSVESAVKAFQQAILPADMQVAVTKYPFMIEKEFIHAVEQVLAKHTRPEHKLAFKQRLTWLLQIASQKQRRGKR